MLFFSLPGMVPLAIFAQESEGLEEQNTDMCESQAVVISLQLAVLPSKPEPKTQGNRADAQQSESNTLD